MTRTFGKCVSVGYSVKELVFSRHLLQNGTREHVLEIVRHEYAHLYMVLKCHRRDGHGRLWKNAAMRFGSNGRRCNDFPEIYGALFRYCVICGGCGARYYYQRKGRIVQTLETQPDTGQFRCPKCGGHRFSLYHDEQR